MTTTTTSALASAKKALVTGSTSGIGKHTADNLASQGYHVILHGRSSDMVEKSKAVLRSKYPGVSVDAYVCDLSSVAGVFRFAEELHRDHNSLDVLINNAGVFESKRSVSEDGFEMTFAVNVVAPLLLSLLCLDLLEQTKAKEKSRLIIVSSISHMDGGGGRRSGTVDFGNLQYSKNYDRYGSYGLSKLLVVFLTYILAEKLTGRNITVNTLDPGTVNTKMLLAGWGPCGMRVEDANDETFLATEPSLEDVTGKYFVGGRESTSARDTYDKQIRMRVWETLSGMLAIEDDLRLEKQKTLDALKRLVN